MSKWALIDTWVSPTIVLPLQPWAPQLPFWWARPNRVGAPPSNSLNIFFCGQQLFLDLRLLTKSCQCERGRWRGSQKRPPRKFFIFNIFIIYCHWAQLIMSCLICSTKITQKLTPSSSSIFPTCSDSFNVGFETLLRPLRKPLQHYNEHYQACVEMFQKCPERKKRPSFRPTQDPCPVAWGREQIQTAQNSRYFWTT